MSAPSAAPPTVRLCGAHRSWGASALGSDQRGEGGAAGGRAPSSLSPSPRGRPPPGPARWSVLEELRSEAGPEVSAASAVPTSRGGEEFPQLTRLAMPGEGSEV